MAKHMVKCPGCGQLFDANVEEYELVGRRYWHKACREKFLAEQTQEEKDFEDLIAYCSTLFGKEFNFVATKRLIDKYKTDYQYSYNGMLRTLKYWYEVKNNPIDKSKGMIGIVPYAYNDAYNYWYSIWLANQNNQPKILEQYEPKVVEITIPLPRRQTRKRKLFSFLDEENTDGE